VLHEDPRLVGFTSVFQQHTASLALAKRIKQARPEISIVFGGANCEGPMGAETVRQFPFVDAAVSGEGDVVFPELVRRVLESRPLSGVPGVHIRESVDAALARGALTGAPMVRNLDELPYPDYSDYFQQFAASRYGREWQPSVLLETSRGCWWGERMHCTFCGLNGQTMTYRSKSARRALDELVHLSERHPECDVQVTDNILDLGYFKDFLPELARRRLGVSLYYETKANLRKEQVRMLRDAGIGILQPGIESLSDAVLKRMRKGVTGLQNIQLLKWCKELGIEPYWNLLWGFPDEPPEEYRRMARLVPLLTHLPPPLAFGGIRLDRFSPNFFDAERLGFTDVAPLPPYRHIYPLPEEARRNLAYFFGFRYREPREVECYVRPLVTALEGWKKSSERSDLFSVDVDGRLLIWDLRPAVREPLSVLHGTDRALYQACEAAGDLAQIARSLGREAVPGAVEEIELRLEPMQDRGLLLKDGARYLSLAVPLGDYAPRPPVVERFWELAGRLGKRVPGGWVIGPDASGLAPPADVRSPRRAGRSRPRRCSGRSLTVSQFSFGEAGRLFIRFNPE
jgi:ribosomal peptide maturation radical SAM protein 1